MRGQIALISEHASPLSVLGGVDCGGQNLYVAKVAKALSSLGYEVDVFTRRDDDQLPEVVEWDQGIRILYVPAGPARFIRKEDLYPFMNEFTEYMVRFCRHQRKAYDLVHANFWMSGLVAGDMKRRLRIPFVITYQALGGVRVVSLMFSWAVSATARNPRGSAQTANERAGMAVRSSCLLAIAIRLFSPTSAESSVRVFASNTASSWIGELSMKDSSFAASLVPR